MPHEKYSTEIQIVLGWISHLDSNNQSVDDIMTILRTLT